MSDLEIIVLVEVVAAIIVAMTVIALAASLKVHKKGKDRLYDSYGLYAGVTTEELVEIDRAVNAEAVRYAQTAQKYGQNPQNAQNTQKPKKKRK